MKPPANSLPPRRLFIPAGEAQAWETRSTNIALRQERTCPHCAELEAEVARLKRELAKRAVRETPGVSTAAPVSPSLTSLTAESHESHQPWVAAGVSRSTYFRKLKKPPE